MYFFDDYDWFFNILGGAVILFLVLILGIIVLGLIAYWKMFKKAGRKGWESLIPIYSYWVLTEISGLNWWWFLLLAIDVVFRIEIEGLTFAISICSFLASFNCYYNIARRFGKNRTSSIFAGIFPLIFVFIFAFSSDTVFDINIPVSSNGIFGTDNDCETNQSTASVDINNDTSNLQEYSYCGNCGLKLDKNIKFCSNCGRKK